MPVSVVDQNGLFRLHQCNVIPGYPSLHINDEFRMNEYPSYPVPAILYLRIIPITAICNFHCSLFDLLTRWVQAMRCGENKSVSKNTGPAKLFKTVRVHPNSGKKGAERSSESINNQKLCLL